MVQRSIDSENVGPFVEIMSSLAWYSFDDGDSDAIEFGLGETDLNGEKRFAYSLVGAKTVELEMWRDPDGGPVTVIVTADDEIERLAEGILVVMELCRVLPFDSYLLTHVHRDLNRPYHKYGL